MNVQLAKPTSPALIAALHIVFLAKRDDLLELDARRHVYEHVAKYPGLHLSELARALDLDTNHAKYHLRYLEKYGLVSSRESDGYVRFFPRTGGPIGMQEVLGAHDQEILALLRRPMPLHMALVLLDQGEAGLSALAEATHAAPSTVLYHLERMEASGLVTSERVGRERILRLADHDRVLRLLFEFKPPDALVQGFLEAWEQLEVRRSPTPDRPS